jgi:hypothetical protein
MRKLPHLLPPSDPVAGFTHAGGQAVVGIVDNPGRGSQHSDPATRDKQYSATVAALVGIGPRDELEGMMAAQLIAAHNAAMECYRRAMIGEQTFEGRRENLAQANKLSRTYATLLEALNRHRGKGQQKVTVEHVHVHAGGQAVVGIVDNPGRGSQHKSEDQCDAKQIAHAPQPTMRSAHTERQRLSVTSDAERPMSNARRKSGYFHGHFCQRC